ncbi:pyridoxal phosphate-dependent aminotransferase [Arcobacter arenosus]|uniref:pyridoxal phosphate-dependent aminotransferase n=1 Tax=Arcobacter arenosus TaxID=2576037 RepID=UPI003BABD5B2
MNNLKQFSHGGDIKKFSSKMNIKEEDIIDLSSNINFLKPKIKSDFNNLDISSYPSYEKLYEILAKKYSVKASELEIFNGGSSAIFSFFKETKIKECVIYSPAYLEYKKAAKVFNIKTTFINRFSDENPTIKENSLVIFVNPSTPDGRFYNLDDLLKIWIEKNCTIFIDESFLEFSQKTSISNMINKYKKLYVLKSLTKFYSSAGIRLGIILSNKKNILKIKEKEPIWKISEFDQTYIKEALKDKKFIKKTIEKTNKSKDYTLKNLDKIDLIKEIFHSDANFLLLKLNNIKASFLQEELAKYKIMIRDCSNFDFLDESFVRIAIKEKDKMKLFIKALKYIQKKIK